MAESRKNAWTVRLLLLTTFIDILSFGILIPILPLLFAKPDSPYYLFGPGQVSLGYLMLGLNEAAFSGCEFLVSPILGQLADRWGRKPVLLLSLGGTVASFVLLALAIGMKSLPLLFLGRIVDGLTGGNESVITAAAADVTPKEERAKVFGQFDAAFSLGFVFGPLMGGFLSDGRIGGPALPLWIAGGAALLNVFLVWRFYGETLKEPNREPLTPAKSLTNVRDAFRDDRLRGAYLTILLYSCGYGFFTTFYNVFLQQRLHFGQREIGLTFTVTGLGFFAVETLLVGPAKRRFGSDRLVSWALVLVGITLFAGAFAHHLAFLFLLFIPYVLGNGLARPNLSSIVSERVDEADQGRVLGIQGSLQAVGWAVPPILAGGIAGVAGPAAPIAIGGVVVLLSWVVFRRMVR